MRRIFALLLVMACAALFGGCTQTTTTTTTNTANANAATNSNGAREGTGPGGTGIGGTSETNRNATVGGNSNVEPTGVNRNVGATPPPNRNR